MILVAGGAGHLGAELVSLLAAAGRHVRVLTRDPEHARRRLGQGPEIVAGDVRRQESLEPAFEGVDCVISAMTGFGPGGAGPRAIDLEGNKTLIRMAESAGVDRFVLMSMHGAAPDHPMHLLRMKHAAEEVLRAAALEWVIVRPTVFMELWAGIVERSTVIGRGDNPVNFVSVRDVARFVQLAVFDPALSRQSVDVGGPENLTLNEFARQVGTAKGRRDPIRHIPRFALTIARLALRPLRPDLAGLIEAAIAMDSVPMTFDATDLQRRFPQVRLTRLAELLLQTGKTPCLRSTRGATRVE